MLILPFEHSNSDWTKLFLLTKEAPDISYDYCFFGLLELLHRRVVRRLRPCGSRRARSLAGKASARGCYRTQRWLRPCAWRRSAPDRDERFGLVWRRCTSSASISKQFPPLSPRTDRASARPGSPKRASAPAPKGLRRNTSCPPDAARYVHRRLLCERRRRSSRSWTAASETFHRRRERAHRCKPARQRDRRFRRR